MNSLQWQEKLDLLTNQQDLAKENLKSSELMHEELKLQKSNLECKIQYMKTSKLTNDSSTESRKENFLSNLKNLSHLQKENENLRKETKKVSNS